MIYEFSGSQFEYSVLCVHNILYTFFINTVSLSHAAISVGLHVYTTNYCTNTNNYCMLYKLYNANVEVQNIC